MRSTASDGWGPYKRVDAIQELLALLASPDPLTHSAMQSIQLQDVVFPQLRRFTDKLRAAKLAPGLWPRGAVHLLLFYEQSTLAKTPPPVLRSACFAAQQGRAAQVPGGALELKLQLERLRSAKGEALLACLSAISEGIGRSSVALPSLSMFTVVPIAEVGRTKLLLFSNSLRCMSKNPPPPPIPPLCTRIDLRISIAVTDLRRPWWLCSPSSCADGRRWTKWGSFCPRILLS